jgi:hypothetical protein
MVSKNLERSIPMISEWRRHTETVYGSKSVGCGAAAEDPKGT